MFKIIKDIFSRKDKVEEFQEIKEGGCDLNNNLFQKIYEETYYYTTGKLIQFVGIFFEYSKDYYIELYTKNNNTFAKDHNEKIYNVCEVFETFRYVMEIERGREILKLNDYLFYKNLFENEECYLFDEYTVKKLLEKYHDTKLHNIYCEGNENHIFIENISFNNGQYSNLKKMEEFYKKKRGDNVCDSVLA